MQENNITIDEYKENLKSFNNYGEELNQSLNELNSQNSN